MKKMLRKNLIIINNEKITKDENKFYCDNVDIKTIPEELNDRFNVTLIARGSNIKKPHQVSSEKIYTSYNIFTFFINIIKTFKKNEARYLIISITPYTFVAYLLLFFFRKKVFVYLRSNGYEEYKAIFGFIGPIIYYFMFKIVTFKSIIISCQERLFKKEKSKLVFPSELNSIWFENNQEAFLDKPRLLYIGRVKVEKGIFSLLKIFKNLNIDAYLSVVGKTDSEEEISTDKVEYIGHGYDASELIGIYDHHNIFILPSFTEAHPKVIDESLARIRPVIIFEDIKHIVQNRKGIFVSKRNAESLSETINYILKNYVEIQENIRKNKLPTKKEFIAQLFDILNFGVRV